MNGSKTDLMALFCEALEQPSAEERAAYLDEACGEDLPLRAHVERLLRAHEQAGGFLEVGPAVLSREQPGAMIGPYKLLEEIGEGGFGVVYMAEQTVPVRRRVALKILKPGMDTRQVVARFEAERQALALMDDPHIARVLDAGETNSGRPYFVMELVRGVAITDFCDQNQLAPRQRLELFLDICQAVQHAHLKGIIHRDLKPPNILVTLHDGRPVVKVIDFGIAKALGEQLTEKTLFTSFAQMVGTPRYMSPEQAERSGLGIDTRTDIYSLGVILYELLTGTTPLEQQRLSEVPYDEVRRLISDEESPRPSTRMSTLGLAATVISARRNSDAQRLSLLMRGELDWIVLKALEKDRTRRYETASALAADVERYLHDEPVLACPPSKWYRFGKFARRHKLGMALGAAVVTAGILAVAGLAASNALIRQEQSRTRFEKSRAEQAQILAEERAEKIRRDLRNLTEANALLDQGRYYSGERRWDDAHSAFTKAIDLRPDQVSAWMERGDLLALLGLWDLAAADFAREVELRQPDVTRRYFLHALLRLRAGDTAGYQAVRRRARERFSGTTRTMLAHELLRLCNLGPDAENPLQSVELARNLMDDGPRTWSCLYSLGVAHYRAGQYDEAIRRLRESLDADPACVVRPLSYPVLAMAYYSQGEADLARQALNEAAQALDRWTQRRYESQHRISVVHRGAVATWPVAWWEWLECELFYAEAKQLIDGLPPPEDPRLLVLSARAFAGLQWTSQAGEQYDEALKLRPEDPQIRLEAHRNRGYGLAEAGRWSEAAVTFARAVEIAPDEAYLWRFRAVALLAAGRVDEYREVCVAMMDRFDKTSDAWTACNVVFACVLGADALTETARLLPVAEIAAPYYHFGAHVRGAALYRAGRHAEAAGSFETAAKNYCPRAWESCFVAMAQHRLGQHEKARRSLAKASRWIEDANRAAGDDLSGTSAMWDGRCERAVYPLLLEEAKGMIETE
ncbi:MAG TPA: protein kinase [Pirellulales bacterium]|jgi:hypothetical protein|nr:protein kinase [Pirellulales bacterium]